MVIIEQIGMALGFIALAIRAIKSVNKELGSSEEHNSLLDQLHDDYRALEKKLKNSLKK